MLATDKIAGSFEAIVEEAEALKQHGDLSEDAAQRVKTIISIAKHQSDIRKAKPGTCASHKHSA